MSTHPNSIPLRHGQVRSDMPGNRTLVQGQCRVTRKPYQVVLPTEGLNRWLQGDLIQVALPGVSADDREFLVSGTSPEGWAKMFPEEGDDA